MVRRCTDCCSEFILLRGLPRFLAFTKCKAAHKIEHLAGSPHGPSLSFFSTVGFSFTALALFWVLLVSFAFPFVFAASAFLGPSSHAKLTFLTVSPNFSPWMVATSSSRADGVRDPSEPAKVPAPLGMGISQSASFFCRPRGDY